MTDDHASPPRTNRRPTVGCVSFLNARPLIDGLDGHDGRDRHDGHNGHDPLTVRYDVPSRLLDDLISGAVDIALCPVIDFQIAPRPLRLIPVGGIGCDGPTLTVRLFSPVPFEQVQRVYADTDSHTSIALMRIILHHLCGIQPAIVDLPAPEKNNGHWPRQPDTALLLIGDKVVTAAPHEPAFPHQLDLGVAWKQLTGLPFVFAAWMTRADTDLADLPDRLDRQRRLNAHRIDAIANAAAPAAGWPNHLARRYLGSLLRYEIDRPQLNAIQHFWEQAHELGIIEQLRPLALYEPTDLRATRQ